MNAFTRWWSMVRMWNRDDGLEGWIILLQWSKNYWICQVVGHNYHVSSCVESGTEDVECDRCGDCATYRF